MKGLILRLYLSSSQSVSKYFSKYMFMKNYEFYACFIMCGRY
jgi:hypothetical protein